MEDLKIVLADASEQPVELDTKRLEAAILWEYVKEGKIV